jgi:hypothetical protein
VITDLSKNPVPTRRDFGAFVPCEHKICTLAHEIGEILLKDCLPKGMDFSESVGVDKNSLCFASTFT